MDKGGSRPEPSSVTAAMRLDALPAKAVFGVGDVSVKLLAKAWAIDTVPERVMGSSIHALADNFNA